jgi:hypothetical protein
MSTASTGKPLSLRRMAWAWGSPHPASRCQHAIEHQPAARRTRAEGRNTGSGLITGQRGIAPQLRRTPRQQLHLPACTQCQGPPLGNCRRRCCRVRPAVSTPLSGQRRRSARQMACAARFISSKPGVPAAISRASARALRRYKAAGKIVRENAACVTDVWRNIPTSAVVTRFHMNSDALTLPPSPSRSKTGVVRAFSRSGLPM